MSIVTSFRFTFWVEDSGANAHVLEEHRALIPSLLRYRSFHLREFLTVVLC